MFARSTTFHGRPEKIDAGIRYFEREAAPLLARTEGCRGLSLLVDRATGQCIATSSWESEDLMLASGEPLHQIRERGRDILGGSMQIDSWEVAVMHRSNHGQCCRASWLEGDVASMAETFRTAILSQLEQTPGFCSASLLLNRMSGVGCATTCWESHAALEASRSAADDLRSRSASDAGGSILDVHEFELAYAHLHLPEMA